MITGLGFSPRFLGFPIRYVLSISLSLISKCTCSFTALIHALLVFSCFFSGKQLRLECCSCFSTALERSPTFCANPETFFVKLFMISSLSFHYTVVKSTASLSSCRWLLTLNCLSFSSVVLWDIYVIYLFFHVFMRFNNIVTHSGSFKLSVSKSSGMSLDVHVFKLPSLGFLDPSTSLELLLKSLSLNYDRKIL